jgi:NhaP-type Na+/H+ or K+/H+ antiporter
MVYASMTPILRHIGYGMTWQHCMACVWGGLRGPLSLCLALIVLQTPAIADAGEVNFLNLLTFFYYKVISYIYYNSDVIQNRRT